MHMMSAFLKCLILIVGFIFLSGCFTSFVSGKRGCSSFGHSCYGGHGKRSKGMDDNTAEVEPTRFTNGFINDKYFTKHHAKFAPLFMRLYKTSRSPPNGDMNMFMKKLVKSINEYQRSRGGTSYLEG